MKKLLLIVLSAALVVGGGIYVLRVQERPATHPSVSSQYTADNASSTPSETIDLSAGAIANWSVCRNEKYGYEFKYPKGWNVYGSYSRNPPQVVGITLCERGMSIHFSPTGPSTQYDPTKQEFSVFAENQMDLTGPFSLYAGVQSIDEYRKRSLKVTPSILPVLKETIVDGENAIWVPGGVEVFHKGSVFHINFMGLSDTKMQDAIISTFKFID
ncbi:MAG: hypothetical protein ACYC6X_00700 [Minisyncoccota bacterium]